jgi:hypothetical protein
LVPVYNPVKKNNISAIKNDTNAIEIINKNKKYQEVEHADMLL